LGKNITGKWYEIQDPNASLEFTIDKTNDAYSGIYNWERKDQTSTINTPIESVTVKNDSLLIAIKVFKLSFKFQIKKRLKQKTTKVLLFRTTPISSSY
jgi:hypothetical protein